MADAQATIPNTNGTVVAHYPSVPYVGQYAKEDYSVFCQFTFAIESERTHDGKELMCSRCNTVFHHPPV